MPAFLDASHVYLFARFCVRKRLALMTDGSLRTTCHADFPTFDTP